MKFYQRLRESVEYDGVSYPLDLRYWRVLAAYDALSDVALPDDYKVRTALDILVKGEHPADVGLLLAILEPYKEMPTNEAPIMDMGQDAELVYAAFWQAYGIDLYKSDMHFEVFRALLKGLPPGTQLSEVMKIRSMDVPEPNGHNGKQIAEILRAKAKVALRKHGSFSDGLNMMFEALKKRAVVKE